MLSSIIRRKPIGRSLALALVATAISGGCALASTTYMYFINFGKATTINERGSSANWQIWGLGYARVIYGGKRNNIIVGDGSCLAGSTTTQYCSTAPIKGSGAGHVIYGDGTVSNTIYSGYGPHEVIHGGSGHNTISSAPTSSIIYGGNRGDTINADQGSTHVYAGTGTNTIYALTPSPQIDVIHCSGRKDTVYAYKHDVIHGCAHVIYEGPRATRSAPSVESQP
jgi:hypothetical protein